MRYRPCIRPPPGDLPTLTDKGYTGEGIGIMIPTNGRNLAPDNQARNGMIGAPRAGRTRQHPAQTDLAST
jgi:hypothetical protein